MQHCAGRRRELKGRADTRAVVDIIVRSDRRGMTARMRRIAGVGGGGVQRRKRGRDAMTHRPSERAITERKEGVAARASVRRDGTMSRKEKGIKIAMIVGQDVTLFRIIHGETVRSVLTTIGAGIGTQTGDGAETEADHLETCPEITNSTTILHENRESSSPRGEVKLYLFGA